jgi:hypothetical protein
MPGRSTSSRELYSRLEKLLKLLDQILSRRINNPRHIPRHPLPPSISSDTNNFIIGKTLIIAVSARAFRRRPLGSRGGALAPRSSAAGRRVSVRVYNAVKKGRHFIVVVVVGVDGEIGTEGATEHLCKSRCGARARSCFRVSTLTQISLNWLGIWNLVYRRECTVRAARNPDKQLPVSLFKSRILILASYSKRFQGHRLVVPLQLNSISIFSVKGSAIDFS